MSSTAAVPNALERRFPDVRLPRLQLGSFPTPVQRLPLSLNGSTLWCKREDLSGESYGGNKVRKLEYLLEGPSRTGKPLLSIGADGSHHLIAMALYGRALGLATYGVYAPQPSTPHVQVNRELLEALLADRVEVSSRLAIPSGVVRMMLRIHKRGDPLPLHLPAGGSSPLGAVGWVAGGLEIAEQVEAGELPELDQIWVPLGSGGNAAGLLLGLRLAGLDTQVWAVRVVEMPLVSATTTRLLAARTLSLLRSHGLQVPRRIRLRGMHVVHKFIGPGYGAATPEADQAEALARAELGLELEATYTAKTLAACLHHLRSSSEGVQALFLNTVNSRPLTELFPSAPSP